MFVVLYDSCFFFFKQKTAYEMRISDWSSDVCSSDLATPARKPRRSRGRAHGNIGLIVMNPSPFAAPPGRRFPSSEFIAELDVELARRREHVEIGRASCRERVCQYV